MCPICLGVAGVGLGMTYIFGFDPLTVGLILGAFVILLLGSIVGWLNGKRKSVFIAPVVYSGYLIISFLWFYAQRAGWLASDQTKLRLSFGLLYGSLVFFGFYGLTKYFQKKCPVASPNWQKAGLLAALILIVLIALNIFNYLAKGLL